MKKEEFLKIAERRYDEIVKMRTETDDLYDIEKNLDKILVEMGRETLEKVLEEKETLDRRKKNGSQSFRKNHPSH